jgi:hypothetical protein
MINNHLSSSFFVVVVEYEFNVLTTILIQRARHFVGPEMTSLVIMRAVRRGVRCVYRGGRVQIVKKQFVNLAVIHSMVIVINLENASKYLYMCLFIQIQ